MNLESEQDVYARLLTRAEPKRGYPLWCPEPSTQLPTEYHDDGYRIGDVGVVTEHGSFDVFFNICLPSSHPLHSRYGVPEGFKQIRLSDRDIESFEHFDKHGRVVSTRSIMQTNLAVGGSTSGLVHLTTAGCFDDLTICLSGRHPYKVVLIYILTHPQRKAQS